MVEEVEGDELPQNVILDEEDDVSDIDIGDDE